jgi:hypothetical protein
MYMEEAVSGTSQAPRPDTAAACIAPPSIASSELTP